MRGAALSVEVWFLVPQPVFSLAYLWAGRCGWVHPKLLPLIVVGLFPAAAAAGTVRRLVRGSPHFRADVFTAGVALLELAWAALTMAIAATAAAWRVG